MLQGFAGSTKALNINGKMTTLILDKKLDVLGDALIRGKLNTKILKTEELYVKYGSFLHGNLTVDGFTRLNGNLDIYGNTKLHGNIFFNGPAPNVGDVLTFNGYWRPSPPTSGGSGSVTLVNSGAGLTGGPITTTGTLSIANTGVVAGTYGSATKVPTFIVNSRGQLTSAGNVTITGVTPGGTASGDLTGSYPGPNVAKLQGTSVSAVVPTPGQTLVFTAGSWTPTTVTSGTVTNVASGTGLTGGPITTTGTLSIANTGVTAGTYGSSTFVPRIIVNSQGQLTFAGNIAIATSSGTVTNVASVTGLTGGPITSTGTLSIANTGVTAGTYGSSTVVPRIIVNSQGQLTFAGNIAIATSSGTVTNVASGAGLTGGPITTTGTLSIANTGVTAGTYGSSTQVPRIIVNSRGQLTFAGNISIASSGWTGNATSNLNMNCYTVSNVMALHVGNLFGKSPIQVHDNFNIKNTVSGGRITWENSVQIGDGTTTGSSINSIAIGKAANVTGTSGIGIGKNCQATGSPYAVAIGGFAFATNSQTVAIGPSAAATGDNAVAIGSGASSIGFSGTAVGRGSTAYSIKCTAIGYNSSATGTSASALGPEANCSGFRSLAVGYRSQTSGGLSVSMGYKARSFNSRSVAIGTNAATLAATSVGIGNKAYGNSVNSIALGNQATVPTTASQGMAIGYLSSVNGSDTIAIGAGSLASTTSAIALGKNAQSTSVNAIAIGTGIIANQTDGLFAKHRTPVTTLINSANFIIGTNEIIELGPPPTQATPQFRTAMYRWAPTNQTVGGKFPGPWGAFDGKYLWIPGNQSFSVVVFDPNTRQPAPFSPISGLFGSNQVEGCCFDGTYMWVANNTSTVYKYFAATGAFVSSHAVGTITTNMAFDGTNIWCISLSSGTAGIINATTGTPTSYSPLATGLGVPGQLAFDGTYMWITDVNQTPVSNTVKVFNVSTGATQQTITDGTNIKSPNGICFDGQYMWIANYGTTVCVRNATTYAQVFQAASTSHFVAFDGVNVYGALNSSSVVTKYNPSTGAVLKTYTAGATIGGSGIFTGAEMYWLTVTDPGSALVIPTGLYY